MNAFSSSPGLSAVALYVPRFRVSLESWCEWTDHNWEKISSTVGSSFRLRGPHENVYTMAANAVLRLIRNNELDPLQIGFLALGTESSTDNAAGAIIIRGLVDRGLESLGLPRLPRQLEVPEFKHACLGGIYAIKGAVRYVSQDGAGRSAIVVSADAAEYARGSSGEPTQGAGAVAMLIERTPKMLEWDLMHAGSASDFRVIDFRKPVGRHFIRGYARGEGRFADYPVFNGRYSISSYLDETAHAVDLMLDKLEISPEAFYQGVSALFFHRPYRMMPVQAMAMLQVRAMALCANADFDELCASAGVAADDVRRDVLSQPDLRSYATFERNAMDPFGAASAAANTLRKQADFQAMLGDKMYLGSEVMANLGNLYTAALPAWIAAGFDEAAQRDLPLAGTQMAAIGYGSGDAAEAIPLRVCDGWEAHAARIGVHVALDDAIDLNQAAYEAMHDRGAAPGVRYEPHDEFVIDRVGLEYTQQFQDIGIEYYEYVA